MKTDVQNNVQAPEKNHYEEIADFPEKIAEGLIISGNETIDEDSVIDLDLLDFEELGKVNSESLKSSTIIDELEDESWKKETLYGRKDSLIDIEKLSIKINSLTTIKKREQAKEQAVPAQEISTISVYGEEKQKTDTSALENKVQITDQRETDQGKEELVQNTPASIKEQEPEEIPDLFAVEIEPREIDKKEALFTSDNIEKGPEETNKIIESETQAETAKENLNTLSKPAVDNILKIEIPDELLGELPEGFNIDELGKIDLREAEAIAQEDIVSLAKGDLLEELKELNIFPEEKKDKTDKKEIAKTKNTLIKKIEIDKAEEKKNIDNKNYNKNRDDDNKKENNTEPPAIKEKGITEIAVKSEEIKEEITVEYSAESSEAEQIKTEHPENDSLKIAWELENPAVKAEEKIIKEEEEVLPIGKKEEGNVFFLDSENMNSDNSSEILNVDELEDISSSIVEPGKGKVVQLTESSISDRKAITGLIRDNHPTFKDLFREKESDEKRIYFDDDLVFVDNVFLSNNSQISLQTKPKHPVENTVKEKIRAPYEQIMGLLPEEISLIENQLYKIKDKNIKSSEAESEIVGFDQHPADTLSINKYKYILPVPNSLLDEEKKSIEDDISASTALIYEEDVDKIKKKLEDSMNNKIKETIDDITDRIIVYEDSESEKEEIKRLLTYLNGLLEKLPEESIEHFANSEYYELYKKILNNMET